MPILAPDTRDLELGQSQIQPADTYAHPQAEDETILKRAHRARQNGEELSHAFAQLGHTIQSVSSEIGQMGERMGQKSQAEADQEARQSMDYNVEMIHQDMANGGPKAAQDNPRLAEFSPTIRATVLNNVGNDDGYKWALGQYQDFFQKHLKDNAGMMLEGKEVDAFNSKMLADAMAHVKDNPFYGAGYIKQVRAMADKISQMSTQERIKFFESNQGAAFRDAQREEQNKVEHPTADVPLPPTRPAELGGKQAYAGNIQLASDNSSMSDASNDVRRTNGASPSSTPVTTNNGATPGVAGSGGSSAIPFLMKYEGFRENPYWDVNHHRVGYGSDTITRADGSVVEVKPGMKVSKEDAARDLQRRVGQFQVGIRRAIGEAAWVKLPEGAKGALTSVAYNYGSLEKIPSLVAAAKSGDLNAISAAILSRRGDNGGINAKRRAAEASMVLGGATPWDGAGGSTGYVQPGASTVGVPDKVTSPISGVSYNLEKAPATYEAVHSAADQAVASSIGNTVHPNGGNPLSPIGSDNAASSPAKTAANNAVASDASNSSDQNAKAIASAAANAEQLNAAGIAPTKGSVYAAGALGVDNAAKVYKANNGAKASEVIDAATLAKHPEIKRMSVGEVKQWAANKVGERINPLEAKHNATRRVDRMFDDISSLKNAYRREILAKELIKLTTSTGNTAYLDEMPPEWINDDIAARFDEATRHAVAIKDAETSRQRQLQKEQQEVLENGLKQGINEALISGKPISPDMARNPDGSINNKVLDYMREAVNKTLIPETQSVTEMNTQLNNVTMAVATGDWKSLGFDHEPTDNEIVDKFYHNPNLRPQELKELNAKVDAAKKIGVATNIPEVREAGRHIVDWAKEIDKEKAKMAVIEPGSIPVIFADKAQEMYDQRVRQLTGDYIREHHGMPNTWTSITDDARKYVREEIGNSVKAEAEAMKAKAEQLRGGGSTTSKPTAEPAKPTETKIPSSINFNDLTPQEQGRVTSTGYLIRDGAMIKVTR